MWPTKEDDANFVEHQLKMWASEKKKKIHKSRHSQINIRKKNSLNRNKIHGAEWDQAEHHGENQHMLASHSWNQWSIFSLSFWNNLIYFHSNDIQICMHQKKKKKTFFRAGLMKIFFAPLINNKTIIQRIPQNKLIKQHQNEMTVQH